jgi:20S proteasome subunit beta 4
MECLLGIAFRDFVLIAADMTNAHSIMVMKDGMFDYFL